MNSFPIFSLGYLTGALWGNRISLDTGETGLNEGEFGVCERGRDLFAIRWHVDVVALRLIYTNFNTNMQTKHTTSALCLVVQSTDVRLITTDNNLSFFS